MQRLEFSGAVDPYMGP